MDSFAAIDFETADYGNASPCALGIVIVKALKIVESKLFIINPECDFSPIASKINGIHKEDVLGCPTFPEIWDEVLELTSGLPLVAHNAKFDIGVLEKVSLKYQIDVPNFDYYCTMEMARELLCLNKYKLKDVCDSLSVESKNAHNALCDAEACANIMIKLLSGGAAPKKSGVHKDVNAIPELSDFEIGVLKNIKNMIPNDNHSCEIRFAKGKNLSIQAYYPAVKIGYIKKKYYLESSEELPIECPHDQTRACYRYFLDSPDSIILFSDIIKQRINNRIQNYMMYCSMVTENTAKKHMKEYILSTCSFSKI